MVRTTDNNNLDESEEVYNYLICAICPVSLSKPGLGFLETEQRNDNQNHKSIFTADKRKNIIQ